MNQKPTIEIDAMPDDEFADMVFNKLMELEACFDKETMMQLEERFVYDFGLVRRASLGILTKSGKELFDLFQDSREGAVALVYVFDELPDYLKRLEDIIELMNSALTRMMVSYAGRADMDEVLAEGRQS